MTACERTREWVDALLDGELSADHVAALEAHLGHCAACAAIVNQQRRLAADLLLLGRTADRMLDPRGSDETIALVKPNAAPRRAVAAATWRRAGRLAAAILMLVSAGLVAMRGLRPATPPGPLVQVEPARTPIDPPGFAEASNACGPDVLVDDPDAHLAVCLPTQNDAVRLIWFYEPAVPAAEEAPDGTVTSEDI